MEKMSEVCKKLIGKLIEAETSSEYQAVMRESFNEYTTVGSDMSKKEVDIFCHLAAEIDPTQYLIFTSRLLEEYAIRRNVNETLA